MTTTTDGSGAGKRGVRTPAGYTAVTPWIISRDTAALLEFAKRAFGAEELALMAGPDGSIVHAEFRIGDAVVMGFDSKPGWPETPNFIRLFVDDGDATFKRAIEAGAVEVTAMTTLFFGDRVGRVRDPLGNIWWIQTHLEDVAPEEMQRRMGQKQYTDSMEYVMSSLDRAMQAEGPYGRSAVGVAVQLRSPLE
jgi:PhnB protein